jgi:hypothetical protein
LTSSKTNRQRLNHNGMFSKHQTLDQILKKHYDNQLIYCVIYNCALSTSMKKFVFR